MNKVVSVIVPVYNREDSISKCLSTIVKQSYKDLEIIIVNDGSTDGTLDIINKFAINDKRVKVLSKSNGGASSARNLGLDNVNGDYILFVDSDDYLPYSAINDLISIVKGDDYDIICGRHSVVEGDTIFTDSFVYPNKLTSYQCQEYLCNCDNNFVVPWNRVYKKSIWDDLRFPENYILEDEATNHHAFGANRRVCFLNKVTYFHVANDKSVMATSNYQEIFNGAFYAFVDRYYFYKKIDTLSSLSHKALVRLYGSTIDFMKFSNVYSPSDLKKIGEAIEILRLYLKTNFRSGMFLRLLLLSYFYSKIKQGE